MAKRDKKPGDERDKAKHTGEWRNGRKSAIKNVNGSGEETLAPNEYHSNER